MPPPTCFMAPITLKEFANAIKDELGDTVVGMTQSTKRTISTHIDEDKEKMKLVITQSEYAYSRLLPPMVEIFRRLAYALTEIDYESEQGKQAHLVVGESYVWASFCVIAYMFGGVFGALPLADLVLGPVLPHLNAFALACFILPVYGHLNSRRTLRSETLQRGFVLRISFVIGLLLSYITRHPHNWSPPVFVLPLWIGLITCFRASQWGWILGWRIVYVVIATCTPLIGHLLVSHFVYKSALSLKMAPYTVTWTVISGLAFMDLQLRLGRVKRGWGASNIEHFDSAMVYIFTQFWICNAVALPFMKPW